MAEITRRRTGEFLRALLEILLKHPEGLQAREALGQLEQRVKLSEYERGLNKSGGRRFETIVRFATVDLVKSGWLVKSKGKWSITEEGRAALQKYQDPEALHRRAFELYSEWRRTTPKVDVLDDGDDEDESGDKQVTVTYEQAEEQAWGEIEAHLRALPPYEFQELVADLLRAVGYHVSWIAPPGKDGGVDIVAWSDPLGTKPPRIKVQVKRLGASITVGDLRAFMAVLGDEDVGLFVTTSSFTADARTEARNQASRRVTLIDLERLVELWTEYYGKLKESAKGRLPLRPIYFLAPEG
jgi:restriction system protein